MYYAIIGIMATATLMLFYLWQRNRKGRPARQLVANGFNTPDAASEENKPKFHGYIIEPGENCCEAARELNKITFSLRDIVPLPLPECDKEACSCKKILIKERRKGNRRFNPDRRNEIRFHFTTGSLDRRIGKGRRQPDKLWSGCYTL